MTDREPIEHIRRLELTHFKGFRGRHAFDFADADIVLISGPNGFGKTSLLEALALLLTGWSADDPARHLISRKPHANNLEDDPEASEPERCAELRADVVDAEGKRSIAWRIELPEGWKRGDASPDPVHTGVIETRLGAELEARVCTFYQDRMEQLFDETARGTLLRDVVEPRPQWVDWALAATSKAIETLEHAVARQETWEGRSAEQLARLIDAAISRLAPLYRRLVELEGEAWPPDPPQAFTSEGAWSQFASAVVNAETGQTHAGDAKGLPKAFERALEDACERLVREARRRRRRSVSEADAQRVVKLEDERERLLDERKAIEDRFKTLEQDLRRFDAEDPRLPDALKVFQALTTNAARWAKQSKQDEEPSEARFAEVLDQFAAVVPEAAAKCAESIETWLSLRLEAKRRLDQIDAGLERIEHELQDLRVAERIAELTELKNEIHQTLKGLKEPWQEERRRLDFERREQDRRAAGAHLGQAIQALRRLDQALKALTLPSHKLMGELEALADWVMRRFSTVPGLLPLRLALFPGRALGYRVLTADGRELNQLSTGQRAQFGVALMVAQNRVISHLLSHRILLLDDVTTAYDLSNLTREALLWRQLAYGATPPLHRQIFISSHHEDMTNQLLDLLAPPHKGRLRLVRFTDWSPQHGPLYETFDVEPTAPGDDEGRRALVRAIAEERFLWRCDHKGG